MKGCGIPGFLGHPCLRVMYRVNLFHLRRAACYQSTVLAVSEACRAERIRCAQLPKAQARVKRGLASHRLHVWCIVRVLEWLTTCFSAVQGVSRLSECRFGFIGPILFMDRLPDATIWTSFVGLSCSILLGGRPSTTDLESLESLENLDGVRRRRFNMAADRQGSRLWLLTERLLSPLFSKASANCSNHSFPLETQNGHSVLVRMSRSASQESIRR